ncbi:unnamed protein product [Ectocarpus sp. CCAP 1310/34]|nr:unnamed protein product [Ectocarpus sp. CCAP 1310/34]
MHGKKRGRDWKTRSERPGAPSPQASKPYGSSSPPASERPESPPAAARLRWSPSPSPIAPTASESIRRSQSYRAKRDNPVQQAGSSACSLSRTNGGQVSGSRGAVDKGDLASQDKPERDRRGGGSPSPSSSSSSDGRRRRRRRPCREEPLGRVSTGKGSDAPTSQSTTGGSAVGNSISKSGDVEAPSPSKSSAIGKNGASKKKHEKDKKYKKEKKSKKSKKIKKNKDADKGRRSGRDDEGSPSPTRSEHGRRKYPVVDTADGGAPKPSGRRTRSDDFTSPPAAVKSPKPPKSSKPPKTSKPLSAVPSAEAAASSSTPSTSSAGKEKKYSTGKKSKRQAVPASLLSFEDEGEEGGGAEFQGLGAATLNEFKRSHKKSQTESVAAAAAAAAAATAAASTADSTEKAPSVTARLGFPLEKKRDAVLGPSKISTAESRGEREYQASLGYCWMHTVVQCLHAPDDAHTKFDACPPCFFAVFDGHNGHLAADIARSKTESMHDNKYTPTPFCCLRVTSSNVGIALPPSGKLHTYVAKAAPTTGLRGEPTERLEGLLRAGFASTEAEILKETEETKDDGEDDGTGDGDGNGSGNGNSRQDGTTATACLLVGNFLVTANVGDSRAVLGSVGHEGKLRCKNISVDHKPEDPHEKRRIKTAGGEVVFNGCYRVQHENVRQRRTPVVWGWERVASGQTCRPGTLAQFKGQGGQPPGSQVPPPPDMRGQLVSPEPSVKSVELEPHDRVIIVASGKDCDGLWDVMTGLEAVEIAIAAHGKAPTTTGRAPSWANSLVHGVGGGNAEADPANALVREAVKRGTSDNVTAVVTILSWD